VRGVEQTLLTSESESEAAKVANRLASWQQLKSVQMNSRKRVARTMGGSRSREPMVEVGSCWYHSFFAFKVPGGRSELANGVIPVPLYSLARFSTGSHQFCLECKSGNSEDSERQWCLA